MYVRRSEDSAVPVGHEKVIAVVETVRASLCEFFSHFSGNTIKWAHSYQHRGPSRPSRAPPADGSYGEPWPCCLGISRCEQWTERFGSDKIDEAKELKQKCKDAV